MSQYMIHGHGTHGTPKHISISQCGRKVELKNNLECQNIWWRKPLREKKKNKLYDHQHEIDTISTLYYWRRYKIFDAFVRFSICSYSWFSFFLPPLCLLNYSFVLFTSEKKQKSTKISNGTLQIVFKLCNIRAHSISLIYEKQTNLCFDSAKLSWCKYVGCINWVKVSIFNLMKSS